MHALRCRVGSTGENLSAALSLVAFVGTVRVTLFASPSSLPDDGSNSPSSNLPLLAGLAEVAIPHSGTIYVVMDGLFLSAARSPRSAEVLSLLNAVAGNPKMFVALARAPFTEALEPDKAAEALLAIKPVERLTSDSRERFFSLLSHSPETAFVEE